MKKTQILIWQEPNADEMEHKLNADIVIFKTFDNKLLIGYYEIESDLFHVTPNFDNYEHDVYYLFNDIEMFAVLKRHK